MSTRPTAQELRVLLTGVQDLRPVLGGDLSSAPLVVFDLSRDNTSLEQTHLTDPSALSAYLFGIMRQQQCSVGVGRYNEDRVVYGASPLFEGPGERRSVHLGIDLFAAPGTPVHAPLAGTIHSFADNARRGDYGPTLILEHELDNQVFFTLYGHLSRRCLDRWSQRSRVKAGAQIAELGDIEENGGWPPHLHFQLITDMGTLRGDFPGVAAPHELKKMLELCPDPNLVLGIPDPASPRP